MQIYFLSILLNALSGYVLLVDSKDSAYTPFFKNSTFRLILGAASALVGILKLLAVVPENTPVVGDLFPALAGIAVGAVLLCGFYQERATVPVNNAVMLFLSSNKKSIGIASMLSAVLHFLFPSVFLL